jgi:hypothetical protein
LTVLAGGLTLNDLPITLRRLEAISLWDGEINNLLKFIKDNSMAEPGAALYQLNKNKPRQSNREMCILNGHNGTIRC